MAARPILKFSDIDDNFLTCEICSERFENAKSLPCGHTFCQECLEKWAEENRDKELTCPRCRKPWQVPPGGIEKLPTNYQVNSLIDYVFLKSQTVETVESAQTCEFCDIQEATSACVECQQLACDVCVKGTKAVASHLVVSLEEYRANYQNRSPASLKVGECNQHPGIQLKYYCQTCSVPTCLECSIIEHPLPEHRHVHLSEAVRDIRKSMNKTLVKVPDWLTYHEEKEVDLRCVKEKLTNSKEQAISEVDKHTGNLVKKIQENREDILRTINDTYEAKANKFDAQIDSIELAKGKVISSFEYSKSLLEEATDTELTSVHKQTQEKLEGLLVEEIQVDPQVNHHLQYIPNSDFKNYKQGIVIDNKAMASKSSVKVLLSNQKKVVCQLVTCDIHGNEVDQGRAQVTAEVHTEGGERIASEITDNSNGTYNIIFTRTHSGTQLLNVFLFGQLVKDSPVKINAIPQPPPMHPLPQPSLRPQLIPLPQPHLTLLPMLPLKTVKLVGRQGNQPGQLMFPSGVAVSNAGEIFIAEFNAHRVQVFDMSGHHKRLFTVECSGQKVNPWGVACTSEGHLVMADFTASQVVVCDTDGRLLRHFSGGEGGLQKPGGVAVSSDGRIIVTDHGEHCVKIFSAEGQLIRTIGCQGDQPGQFKRPHNVVVNSRGHIIVSDWGNHRIQVFSSDGTFIFKFGKEGNGGGNLKNPRGVAVSENNNIIVCDRGNRCVQIFSPEGDYIGRMDDPSDGIQWPEVVTTLPGQPLKLIVTESNPSDNHGKFRIMQV